MTVMMESASLREQGSTRPRIAGRAKGLAPTVQAHLGRQLKAVYAELASEPVPDRFVQLLEELERQQAALKAEKPVTGEASDE